MSDFTRSLLPNSLAAQVARDPGVASVAKVKLLVEDGLLVFGLDPAEFAYRRLVVTEGVRGAVLAGDHSRKHVGDVVRVGGGEFTSPASTTPATASRTSGSCSRSRPSRRSPSARAR